MRRQLTAVFAAVSLMVAIAFVVPLAFLVRRTAEDRAIDAARADGSAIVPVLVAGGTPGQIDAAIAATSSGRDNRLTVVSGDGTINGRPAESARLAAALQTGASSIGEIDGDVEVVLAVANGTGQLSAVRVLVPQDSLHRGQWTAWSALALVALALVGVSVLAADRLARSIVRPTQNLGAAARRLGRGDLTARVEPEGPPELVELADSFNRLGSEVSSMLERERELVAELSHRLRTPLTKLRMRTEQIGDAALAGDLRGDIDDVTSVVNDLINQARAVLVSPVSRCDATATVAERAVFWSALADDQNRPVQITNGVRPHIVAVAEGDLIAMVDVLIDNVFAHTAPGTPLDIGVDGDESGVRIWVGDGGPGIPDEAVERGHSAGQSTGLGLDIARTTAVGAGGSFLVDRSPLGGALITVTFPVATGSTRQNQVQ